MASSSACVSSSPPKQLPSDLSHYNYNYNCYFLFCVKPVLRSVPRRVLPAAPLRVRAHGLALPRYGHRLLLRRVVLRPARQVLHAHARARVYPAQRFRARLAREPLEVSLVRVVCEFDLFVFTLLVAKTR